MKKSSYYIYCILVFALTFCLIVLVQNKEVKADVDYEINQVKVDAQVEKDGSLLIKRKIKYDFDDSAHGVFYKQNLASGQKLKDSRVEVQDGKGRKILVKPGHGQNNSYQLTKDGNSYRFKVFHHISFFDKFTVTYAYRITNAVTNWADTAELNFKIIGDGWETDLDHVKINLNVENGKKTADLKAWAHGPLDGLLSLNRSRGIIKMTADHVPGDEGIEVHTIFPTKVTAHNKNIRKQKHRQAVIKQEAVLARQANARRKRNRILKITLVSLISILTGLLSIFTWIKAAGTKSIGVKPKGIRHLPHIYDIPTVTPVQAQILDDNDEPGSRAFTAYLTYLAGKKRIEIVKAGGHKHINYEIRLLDPSLKKENHLLKYIFNKIGDGNSFTTKKLRKNCSRKLGKRFDKWSENEYSAMFDQGYFNYQAEDRRSSFKPLFIADIVAVVILLAAGLFLAFPCWNKIIIITALVLFLLDLAVFLNLRHRISDYTVKGAEEANKVRGFKKMLDDIGHFNTRDVGELILWEDIMPYAVAFGLSKKVIKALHKDFSDQEIAAAGLTTNHWLYLSMANDDSADNFSASLDTGLDIGDSSDSSISGGLGGFSDGSSGGFGGGSGGGAF